MKVTRFNYPLPEVYVKKLNGLINRCTDKQIKQDAVLNIEGREGSGKTTLSIANGYYIAEKTGRSFSDKNLFFDLGKMIKFAQSTNEQILIWDEPAFNALSTDHARNIVKDLWRLLMTSRMKRHFYMINLTYFNKFNHYIIAERPNGMIKVWRRQNEKQSRMGYIRGKKLNSLWEDWQKKRQKNQFKYISKKTRSTFPDVLNPNYKNNVLSEFNIKEYERRKQEAINQIGSKSVKGHEKNLLLLKYKISQVYKKDKKIAENLGVPARTIRDWLHIPEQYPQIQHILSWRAVNGRR